jgi:hypothetical protein
MNNQGVNASYIRTCGTVQQTVVFGASHDGAENCGFEVSIAPPSASSVFLAGVAERILGFQRRVKGVTSKSLRALFQTDPTGIKNSCPIRLTIIRLFGG